MKRTKILIFYRGGITSRTKDFFLIFFCILKDRSAWLHTSAISVSWNLQGLNIWNMLIQFYTKFGIGIVSENSKWYGDETSKISHQIYSAKMVKSDTSAKIRSDWKLDNSSYHPSLSSFTFFCIGGIHTNQSPNSSVAHPIFTWSEALFSILGSMSETEISFFTPYKRDIEKNVALSSSQTFQEILVKWF